jgi:chromosomal replication initiation ATPase DnaA
VLVEAVLVKLFIDRQLDVSAEAVRFLMPRIARSFAAAHRVATAVDRVGLRAKRRQITLPLARAALQELETAEAEDSIEGV